MEDVMNLPQAECSPYVSPSMIVNITALREQLAIQVSTGKAKEAISLQLSHKHMKHLTRRWSTKVPKKVWGTCGGGETTETLIDSFLLLTTRAFGMFLPTKNIEAVKKELPNDDIIK